MSFPGGRSVAPIASATRHASPEFLRTGSPANTTKSSPPHATGGKGPPGAPAHHAAACRTRSFSLLTRHDDMSLRIVRSRERRGSQGCSCTPAGLARLREAINPRLEETSFRTALAACVAALLLIVAAVAVALLVSGHGTAGGQGTAADAAPSDPAGTAGTPVATPRPRRGRARPRCLQHPRRPLTRPRRPRPRRLRLRIPPHLRRSPPRLRPVPRRAAHPDTQGITAAEPRNLMQRPTAPNTQICAPQETSAKSQAAAPNEGGYFAHAVDQLRSPSVIRSRAWVRPCRRLCAGQMLVRAWPAGSSPDSPGPGSGDHR